MENVDGIKKKSKRKESRYGERYGLEFKLRCVKLRLEEGLPVSLLSKEAGASKDVIRRWDFVGVQHRLAQNSMIYSDMEGMASPWGVTGRQGLPDQIGSTTSGNREAVKQDKAAMACARLLGLRVAEMAKVIKAGFTLVNPENKETKWPAGLLTPEYRTEDHHFLAYRKKEKE
jgi:transposase-like protein